MNRVSKILVVVVLMLLLVVPLAGAQEQNIVQIAIQDGRFSTLLAAAVAAELDTALAAGQWTVFAPTDAAFAKLGLDADNVATLYSKEELQNILLYHVLTSKKSTADLKADQGDFTMANGALAGVKYFDGAIYVNEDAKVIIPDLLAANGTIHVVDNVILPPWPRSDDQPPSLLPAASSAPAAAGTITGIAVSDPRFSTLEAAVVAADLAGALSGGQWTVFAPTDTAFAKLGLDAATIAEAFTPAELKEILLYHVLTSSKTTTDLKADQGDLVMANGALAGVKYFDGSIYVNDDVKVTTPDVIAQNGTIHIVDTVILPPWPRQ